MGWLQNKFEKNFMISTVDYVFNWARKSAVWPLHALARKSSVPARARAT